VAKGTRPFRIGLTGSIGMGKTETAKLFRRAGIPVYHADEAVHALYAQGGAAVAPIAAAFPDAVLEGHVDRERLGTIVAGDERAFRQLEARVHPLVGVAPRAFLDKAAREGAEFVVLDIPLLFETGQEGDMDAVVVASAPEAVQRERVLSRPRMTEQMLAAILARQVPDSEKRAKADFVIETDKGLEQAYEQVKRVIAALNERKTKEQN
jgi:dephospho-CoA kinase